MLLLGLQKIVRPDVLEVDTERVVRCGMMHRLETRPGLGGEKRSFHRLLIPLAEGGPLFVGENRLFFELHS